MYYPKRDLSKSINHVQKLSDGVTTGVGVGVGGKGAGGTTGGVTGTGGATGIGLTKVKQSRKKGT